MIRVLQGDCRDVLPTLAAGSVQCVVTSPPYFGLRDYGTAQWDGGNAGCDHTGGQLVSPKSTLRLDGRDHLGPYDGEKAVTAGMPFRSTCGKCGATRTDSQIGLEPSSDAYIAELVAVFRAVRRVLRDDGTLWLNLGSSYSTGTGSNVTDQLNRLLEGGSVFFTDPGPCGVAGHRVGVALQHKRTPDRILSRLLAPKQGGVKEGNEDFGKVADLFAYPGNRGASASSRPVVVEPTDAKVAMHEGQHFAVVTTDGNTQAEPIFAVRGAGGAGACEDDKATFTINQADKPSIAGSVRWHSTWDTFAENAIRKGLEDINLVDEAVALRNRPQALVGLLGDFRIAEASAQKVTLASIQGNLSLAVSDVGHLWFVLRCGSIVPYHKLLADASRCANALLSKQDLGVPWRVARALQEDGWILRSPIIWAKPNPMPESVIDRPTSAHEHVFLLTKRADYYFDAAAIAEPATYDGPPKPGQYAHLMQTGGQDTQRLGVAGTTRNARNVWILATEAFPGSHFAVFPTALAERCIRAGTSQRGACPHCGAPWARVVERTGASVLSPGSDYGNGAGRNDGGRSQLVGAMSTTTGWRQTCACPAAKPVPCVVLDPFAGAFTAPLVADRLQRDAIGIELSAAYCTLARNRILDDAGMFAEVAD